MIPAKKITAAHLAGICPRPTESEPTPDRGDASTGFVAGFGFALLALPEVREIFGFGSVPGAPHPTGDLVLLMGFVAFFGIFPIALLHHGILQRMKERGTFPVNTGTRFICAGIGLALMFLATGAMRPLVGLDEKLAENRGFHTKTVGQLNRALAHE